MTFKSKIFSKTDSSFAEQAFKGLFFPARNLVGKNPKILNYLYNNQSNINLTSI
ncbi:MAG: hypothetical protein PHR96_00075 [Clostridia bacterium]|nr:hypothetical protein [Clostridia bacterium]